MLAARHTIDYRQPGPVMGRAGPWDGEGPRDVLVVSAERGDVVGFDPLTGDQLWKSDLGGNCAASVSAQACKGDC